MSSKSFSPSVEPGSSSQSTLQSPPSLANQVRIHTPEAPASLDDLLKSPYNSSLHRHQPGSTLRGASPNDERRRNGFHLWRTESEDARKARMRREAQAAEAQANETPGIGERLRSTLSHAYHRIASHRMFSLYRRNTVHPSDYSPVQSDETLGESKLTRLGLIVLTLSLAGAQLAWTLELAYGTPYLLSLGLSEQSTSLVWLAGPLSGLIAQPVVGSLSDQSTSSFRRRKYMLISAALLTLSTLTLAYSVPISTALVDVFGGGLADWDPRRHELVHTTTQAISVIAFWILDFALNGLQAASRALILDTAPSEQQTIANAWQGRMTHAGNVVGYFCGWVDLASWKGLRWLGGGQFRRFAMVSLLAMISCVSVTISLISESPVDSRFSHHHHERDSICTSTWRKAKDTLQDVWHAIRRLPRSVRRVCLVQLFAFMGWFPFLFYGTTYVLQIAQYERNGKRKLQTGPYYEDHGDGDSERHEGHGSSDRDAEQGSFAMLLFALVSLIAASLLPYLALAGEKRSDNRPDPVGEDESPTPPLYLSIPTDHEAVHSASDPEREEHLSRASRLLRGLKHGLTLRTFWTLASLTFALLMLVGTAWASTVHQATIVIALVGIPWSIAAWAPFAMVGEFVREAEDGASPFEFEGDHWSPTRTRERENARWMQKQRRESLRRSDRANSSIGNGEATSPTGSGIENGRKRFKYIDDTDDSPSRRGEQGARERIRASLIDCAPLPHTLTRTSTDDLDSFDSQQPCHPNNSNYAQSDNASIHKGTGGAGTILGIHNLAIVAPQFVVAIIASLIFSAVQHHVGDGIHLVLGGGGGGETKLTVVGSEGNPAEGTIWVLRFGGTMALLAAAVTRFVPLTLSERTRRYGANSPSRVYYDEDAVE